jgi:hypothetical protein
VQKFTRPLTREIEFAGERLGVTFSEDGLSVRPVGARKPPREITWPALMTLVANSPTGHSPSADEVASALAHIKAGGPAAPKPPAEAKPTEPAPAPAHQAPVGHSEPMAQEHEPAHTM